MQKDFYAVLGVPRNATEEQIEKRFRELTRRKHPDRFAGEEKSRAEAEFQEITQAFNTLMNPERRRELDEALRRSDAPARSAASKEDMARAYLKLGVEAYREGNYVQAAESFDRATEANPESAVAWHHLARACAHRRRWLPRACRAVERACELEPMKVEYLKLAGRIFAAAERTDKAVKYYNRALEWGGEDPEVEAALEELSGGKKRSILGGLFGKAE